jgi:hypothetical protein
METAMTADAGRAAVERYFTEMGEIYRSGGGTEETSYYSAFENLANAIGKELKPRVRCIMQLRNTGAGNPDGGFYAAEQFRKDKDETPMDGQRPERGVVGLFYLSPKKEQTRIDNLARSRN